MLISVAAEAKIKKIGKIYQEICLNQSNVKEYGKL